jgi:antitoxin CptB
MGPETKQTLRRLRWSCRRGMLELDLLLNGFLESDVQGLDEKGLETFERLLDYPDATLLQLLMGQMQSSDKDVAHVVEHIRNSARSDT